MANTLTNLIPTIYRALDQVTRELTGMIPAVYMNATADQVAKDQTVRYPIVGDMSASDISAAATGPDPDAQTVASDTMTIDKSRSVTFYWEGEEQMGFRANGTMETTLQQQFQQAMRALVNEIETDLATTAKQGASRGYGTAGAAPFASGWTEVAEVRQILAENGAPMRDLQLVIPLSWGTDLRQESTLYKANEAGTDELARRGVLIDLQGFAVRESAQISQHTKGTGSGYLVDLTAGYSAGDTSIHVDTGTGTILSGDVITFASGSTNYIVGTGFAGDGDGDIALNAPGLRDTLANNASITIGDSYTPGFAFDRYGIHLLTRTPAMPEGGDAADDVTTVTDPVSGLSFQVAVYRQRRRVAYEVGIAWGKKAVKSDYIATLIG